MRTTSLAVVAAALSIGLAACGGGGESEGAPAGADEELSGTIRIDGSSTVFPFAEAAGELFNEEQPNVQVTVGASGTGGGFEKFCAGETDISNASRPIKDDEEAPVCQKAGIRYEQVQVANDGIAVVTNKDLAVACLTVDQLNAIWEPKSSVTNLSDAGGGLPATPVKLFGPGTDSGTFDFFTGVINGEEGASREDYEASEDDNQLVTGVAGTPGGLGYFGFSYYEANADKLNLVGVGEDAASCKKPDPASIQDGSYTPLSRPIFMYPSDKALQRPEVKAFMEFVVNNQAAIANAADIVPMTDAQAAESKQEVDRLAGVQ
jgi:phosphate transport system substrate-binding protein